LKSRVVGEVDHRFVERLQAGSIGVSLARVSLGAGKVARTTADKVGRADD
jgi:hypothetical protein